MMKISKPYVNVFLAKKKGYENNVKAYNVMCRDGIRRCVRLRKNPFVDNGPYYGETRVCHQSIMGEVVFENEDLTFNDHGGTNAYLLD